MQPRDTELVQVASQETLSFPSDVILSCQRQKTYITIHTAQKHRQPARSSDMGIFSSICVALAGTDNSWICRWLRTDAWRVFRAGQTRPDPGDGGRFGAYGLEAAGRVDAGKGLGHHLPEAVGAGGVLEDVEVSVGPC